MVQDTGFGNEVYQALSTRGEILMYGKEEQTEDMEVSTTREGEE